jgi:hypothetical protein
VSPVALPLLPLSKNFFQTTRLYVIIEKLQQSSVQNADWFRLIRFSTVQGENYYEAQRRTKNFLSKPGRLRGVF